MLPSFAAAMRVQRLLERLHLKCNIFQYVRESLLMNLGLKMYAVPVPMKQYSCWQPVEQPEKVS